MQTIECIPGCSVQWVEKDRRYQGYRRWQSGGDGLLRHERHGKLPLVLGEILMAIASIWTTADGGRSSAREEVEQQRVDAVGLVMLQPMRGVEIDGGAVLA